MGTNEVFYLICTFVFAIMAVVRYVEHPENPWGWGMSLVGVALYLGFYIKDIIKIRKKNKKNG